jgi:hypothetical protein
MMRSEKITRVILSRFPGAKFYTSNNELIWVDEEIPRPQDSDLESWIAEMKEDPNWEKLLRESGRFVEKAQSATNANGFSLLLSTLTDIRSVPYLQMALAQVRSGMKKPYTTEEIAALNKLLSDCNIDLILE